MKAFRVYQCEDTIAGIFTAIYDAWDSHYGHDYIRIDVVTEDYCKNYELFSECIPVSTDEIKSEKVARSIKNKLSSGVFEMVIKAALSNDYQKANSIYHFLVLGFSMGREVVNHLTNPYVRSMFEMNRYVGNEVHRYLGFLRFREQKNGVLFAKIEPVNHVLELITPHFTDRLPDENFLILDHKRNIAAIHPKNDDWFMTLLSKEEVLDLVSDCEEEYENLWKVFFRSISITERENEICQRNHAPLFYRKYMLEFASNIKKV